MALTADEIEALADDLLDDSPAVDELVAQFPAPEPSARTLHPDCRHPTVPVGYSDAHPNTEVIALDRKRYPEFEQAEERMRQLLPMRKLRVVGEPFYTAAYWCWRAVPAC